MRYEIDYFSQTGNTRKLANGISRLLFSGNVQMNDLSTDPPSIGADIYIIGFGLKNGVVPYPVLECLEALEGKTILLFVTCGMTPTEEYRKHVERKLSPFMPEECDYRGMFLCLGEFPRDTVYKAQQAGALSQPNDKAEAFLEHCREASGHPSQQDITEACAFIRARLA